MPKPRAPTWPLLVSIASSLASHAVAEVPRDARTGKLVVEVSNIPNDRGQVGCSLYDRKDGFPSDPKKATASMFVAPKSNKAICTFKSVKPGKYAVSVMHDENKDGELKTTVLGRPKEWWGVSNNAPAERFGPPKYEAAVFDFHGDSKTIRIKLRL